MASCAGAPPPLYVGSERPAYTLASILSARGPRSGPATAFTAAPFSAPALTRSALTAAKKARKQKARRARKRKTRRARVRLITLSKIQEVSAFWQQLMQLLGSKLGLSTAYYPQTDGQSEKANGIVGTWLGAFARAILCRQRAKTTSTR